MTGETGMSLAVVGKIWEAGGADCTSSGRVFQKMEAAIGNERRPAVDRRYCGMCSCSVNDDRRRRRRRPGRLDTGTSWFSYGGAMPFNTRYVMSASLKFTRSDRHTDATSIVSRGRQTRGHSNEVEIPSELRRWVRRTVCRRRWRQAGSPTNTKWP